MQRTPAAALWLKRFLWIYVGGELVSLLSHAEQLRLLHDREALADIALLQANDSRQQIIAVASLVIYGVTAVFFARWIIAANRSVRALGAHGLSTTPGWAVGYFFVPFLNLIRPYQAMTQLWQASDNARDWAVRDTPRLLPIWWALWIANGLLGQAALRWQPADLESLRNFTLFNIATSPLPLALGGVALTLVTRITAQIQAQKAEIPPPVPATALRASH